MIVTASVLIQLPWWGRTALRALAFMGRMPLARWWMWPWAASAVEAVLSRSSATYETESDP